MVEEKNRAVFVKSFDRYARQAIHSHSYVQTNESHPHAEDSESVDQERGEQETKPSVSSVFYNDLLVGSPEMKVKGVLESTFEGLVLIAESESINEIKTDVDESEAMSQDDAFDQSDLFAETEEFNAKDIIQIQHWIVWLEHYAQPKPDQSRSSFLMGLRQKRIAKWQSLLSPTAQFESEIDLELVDEFLIDPSHARTLSMIGKESDLLLDLESEQSIAESEQTFVDDSSGDALLKGYWIARRNISQPTIEIKLLKALMPQEQPQENLNHQGNAVHSASSVVRTVKYTVLRELIDSALPLFKLIDRLHQNQLCLGGFDPALFVYSPEDADSIAPIYPLPLIDINDPQITPNISGEESSLYLGFSPPEMYGYFHAKPCFQSDVFSAGMILYYALTGCPRFMETRRPFFRLPSPFVYRQDLSPELVAVIYRAISPDPHRRQANMSDFIRDIEWALASAKQREEPLAVPLKLEAGQEIHIGLLKGQYNPINQDDLFLGYQAELDLGLFVVTDGVSICEYGSGDLASGFVRESAVESWRELCQVQTLTEDEDTLSEMTLGMIEGVSGNYGKFLNQLVNDSNRRIGKYINEQMPTFHGPPEGIMAATIVAAVINQGVATLTSVGDSRIYLIRNGYIINLMYDEDLYTHLLQAKQSPTQAQQSPSSSALVHCVGEFTKDSESKLVASQLTPQLREMRLLPGDQILLCSDGLPDYSGIDEADAEDKMRKCVEESFNVHHAAFELISLANRGGGGDNLSCIVLKFTADQDVY